MSNVNMVRRRRAWAKGVIAGATNFGRCELSVPKLKDLYEAGVAYGRTNANSPEVKSMVELERRKRAPKAPPRQQNDRFRGRAGRPGEPSRFGRPGGPNTGGFGRPSGPSSGFGRPRY